jgi:energy-coupling factor transporter ATP-binding protein EcfA2
VIALEGVSVRYPGAGRPSLTGVDLDASGGQVIGIAGASESGKTTLCLVLAGLIPRVVRATMEGRLLVAGEDVGALSMHALCERVSILTGTPDGMLSLIADTVFEEVAFGPANLGLPRDEVIRRVASALATVGLEDLVERAPGRLSTGQAQRLAIASVLAMGARCLVLDEPAAHLDADASERLVSLVRALAARGHAVVIASTDTRLLAEACDRVAILAEGRLGPVGPIGAVLTDPRLAAAGLEPIDVRTPVAR